MKDPFAICLRCGHYAGEHHRRDWRIGCHVGDCKCRKPVLSLTSLEAIVGEHVQIADAFATRRGTRFEVGDVLTVIGHWRGRLEVRADDGRHALHVHRGHFTALPGPRAEMVNKVLEKRRR